ncbi:MAG TPA: hypothetical protein VFZ09_36545 [Archangium sp.]|uniref:hypothetical protein n=1 Tax=Archangium sp. TaxID=1872627 RepID=UPI002E300C54|nr:hypothetical protein [Archangium sp.]HEX5751787.1 hypothetical protein [Archangium sp.]
MSRARTLVLALGVLAGAEGRAQEPGALSGDVPAANAPAWLAGHRFSVYLPAGAQVYLSDTRTAGGIGGGVGLRDTFQERFILQVDATYHMLVGNSVVLRAGAGIQRRGVYTPAVLVTLSTFVGDRLTFLTPAHPSVPVVPPYALGLQLAPLRFTYEGMQVSLAEVGIGAGLEFPGVGFAYRLGVLEVSIPLE